MITWKNILIVMLAACMAGYAGNGGSGPPPNPNVTVTVSGAGDGAL